MQVVPGRPAKLSTISNPWKRQLYRIIQLLPFVASFFVKVVRVFQQQPLSSLQCAAFQQIDGFPLQFVTKTGHLFIHQLHDVESIEPSVACGRFICTAA
ncbi:MAG: hypothetical protein RIK87_05765 [Fuerstiella sp.]